MPSRLSIYSRVFNSLICIRACIIQYLLPDRKFFRLIGVYVCVGIHIFEVESDNGTRTFDVLVVAWSQPIQICPRAMFAVRRYATPRHATPHTYIEKRKNE